MTRNQARAVFYGRKKPVYLGTQVVKCECGSNYIIRPHDETMNFAKCPACRKQDESKELHDIWGDYEKAYH